jgi:hypothetical protein
MVVRIKTGKSIKGALNYNENKVKQGVADIILASGFACDIKDLGFSEKLKRFTELIENSSKVTNNTLHISLNFSPNEEPNTGKLQSMARDYMEWIGFKGQPYLVYRHEDAAHPHVHIVTTPIKQNGRSINIHNIGKRLSEPARKAIEQEYGLVVAESRKKTQALPLKPVTIQAAYYGKSETKRIISNIVQEVMARYKFTSLDELNAVFRQFNVVADRGSVNSRMYQNGGLVYCIIDKNGYKTGVPIKASSIYTNPTLATLQKKLKKNQVTRPTYQKIVQSKVLNVLSKSNSGSMFMAKLREKNIHCSVQYENKNIKEIRFVDHSSRSVFSCGDLGITVNALLSRLTHSQSKGTDQIQNEIFRTNEQHTSPELNNRVLLSLLEKLLESESHQPDLSPEFLRKKKKKRTR